MAQAEGRCLVWLNPHMLEAVHLGDCQGQLVGLAEAQVRCLTMQGRNPCVCIYISVN